MYKLLFSAAIFAAVTTAQKSGMQNLDDDIWMRGDIETTADFEGDMHSYDFFGDCIGLSPIVFGTEGQYVQSDMQFAQQVQDDIRNYSDHIRTGVLDPSIAMELMSRFYVRDDQTNAAGNRVR